MMLPMDDQDMSVELTAGVDMWHFAAVEDRLRSIKVTDGPAGARGERWFGGSSACVPCGTALGATFSTEAAESVAGVLARETLRKGADVLLAPTVNLHRHPLAGRNFECMSEDPELTARLTVAWINALQSAGVAACVKHLVANDQETDRHSISVEVQEAVLRELYLRPFEAAVREAGTWTIMAAYNRLDGEYCSSNRWLLTKVLRGEWGFEGVVMSDWWGTHSTAAVEAGLDVEMPGPGRHMGQGVADAIDDGSVTPAAVMRSNDAVMALGERTGALGATESDPVAEQSVDDPEDRRALRAAASRSMVLLRNRDGVLPLGTDADADTTVAVSGPNAEQTAIMGGGSAAFVPHHSTDLLSALKSRVASVSHHSGVPAPAELPALSSPGPFTVEHFDTLEPTGDPVVVEESLTSRLLWMGPAAPGLPDKGTSVKISGELVARRSGEHSFGLVTGATGWLSVDGTVILDNRDSRRSGTAFFGMGSAEERTQVSLEAGERVRIEAFTTSIEAMAFGGILLGHAEPGDDDPIGAAVEAASSAETAVVVVGGNAQWETEGTDRDGFDLPNGQPELVRAVCGANPRTIVVVNCGAPVDLSCADEAAAILLCWYPGQEGAEAIADVLLGEADPGGRLPATWGFRQSDWQSDRNFPGDGTTVRYVEGFGVGYRGFDRDGIEPAYCFGHGLSYATFDWTEATLDTAEISVDGLRDGAVLRAGLTLTNSSDRPGVSVVQCYLAPTGGDAVDDDRPPQWLAGFASLELAPGESRSVSIPLGEVAFRRWDSGWVVPTGDWELRLSASSRDHRFSLPIRTTG